MSKSRLQRRIDRMYRSPESSIYSNRLFEDLSSGYSYSLGDKSDKHDFFCFNPKDCKASKLIKRNKYYSSYDLERMIDRIAYSLVAYGKAYLFIDIEYKADMKEDGSEVKTISAIQMRDVEGIIRKRRSDNIVFLLKAYNGTIKEITMSPKQFVVFDIKDVGYSRRFFGKILKKLEQCDVSSTTEMLVDKVEGYDFSAHRKNSKMRELRALRGVGWSFGSEDLSDSYILYKKILADELKIKFLEYILGKINHGIAACLGKDAGSIVAEIKRKDYRQLWKDYSEGKLTGTELTNILYHE